MKNIKRQHWITVSLLCVLLASCTRERGASAPEAAHRDLPSILLVTLDTTRFDAIGPLASGGTHTPAYNALAAEGRQFLQAYSTAPETLPSHSSMMTGLYPAAHGVHENARFLDGSKVLVAELLKKSGYDTAAFISGFPLEHRFGLSRGFDLYDDELGGGVERTAKETTDHAVTWLAGHGSRPSFLWVHYFDAHAPYEPPSPFREQFAKNPYLGEVAAVDQQLGRLLDAFRRESRRAQVIIVVADHGESLGEHGEKQHGHLLYQAVMHVPLLLVGPGVPAGTAARPVSTRRIYDTILDFAGIRSPNTLRNDLQEVVLGEGMIPYLQYGWQPQVMAVDGQRKAILAGRLEIYDLGADPAEAHDLGAGTGITRPMREALRQYPV
ncbi:MAG: sulfatase, partial [Acidobacteriota bacterium]